MSYNLPEGVSETHPHIDGYATRDANRYVECDECDGEGYDLDGTDTLLDGEILFDSKCPNGHPIERTFPIEDDREHEGER